MRFCDKLAHLRKTNNLSQEQLADKMGVSRQSVSKWESGTTYPDMDKMLQLCKILDCKLDELMDDGVIGDIPKKENNKIINYFKIFLDTIAKIYNMFCSMKFKEKVKCIFEIIFLSFLTFMGCLIVFCVLEFITTIILDLLPIDIFYYFTSILESIYMIILIIIGILIVFHLFKIRYLDYFKVVDKKEQVIIENVKQEFISEPVEKIIIRDPKHSKINFSDKIKKFIKIIFKFWFTTFLIPIVCILVIFSFLFSISLYHIFYGALFVGLTILFLTLIVICYIVIEMIVKFLFNKKQSYKRIFVIFISSVILFGISIGILSLSIFEFEYIEENALLDLETETKTTYIDIKENTNLDLFWNVDYIIDNSLDEAKLEITYIKGFEYDLDYHTFYYYDENTAKEVEEVYLDLNQVSLTQIYDLVLKDLKDKKLRYYNPDEIVSVKVYLSQKNYDIIEKNS